MTDGKYKITRELDNSSEVRALRQVNDANEKVIQQLREQKKTHAEMEREAKKTADTFVTGAKQFVTALIGGGGVLAAQRLVTEEMERQAELQRKAAAAQVTLAQAQRGMRRNLVGVDEGTIRGIEEQFLPGLAKQTNVTQKDLTLAFSGAISSAGGNIAMAKSATQYAAQYAGDDPGAMAELAAGLVNLGKTMGTTDMGRALGLMALTGAETPVKEARLQAVNIPKGVGGIANLGYSTAESAAMFSTLAYGAGDITGEASGTAGIQLAKQLRGFKGLEGIGTLRGQVGALQADAGMRKRFLDTVSVEAKYRGVVEQLLDPGSRTAADWLDNLNKMAGGDLMGVATGAIATVGGGRLGGLEELGRAFPRATEGLLATNSMKGLAGLAREQVPELLDSTGRQNIIEKKGRALEYALRGDRGTVEYAITSLNQELNPYEPAPWMERVRTGQTTRPSTLDPEMRQTLTEMRDLLKENLLRLTTPAAGEASNTRAAGLAE